ncbi:MAG: hypothetical protein ABIJ09_13075 [Pseudomonadota bacterium]
MAVRNDRARSDFSALNKIARDIHGPEARIVDSARSGVPGQVDAKDTLEFVKGGTTVSKALGVDGTEDLVFRKHVVDAAYALAAGGASFSGHHSTDKVNKTLWTMGYGGKMAVRKFMPDGSIGKPSAALRDIFENGQQYGFECATAMMVIYHKAILDHIGDAAFDKLFSEPRMLAFFRWDIEDSDFKDVKRLTMKPMPLVPGSHYYYKNPDASDANSAFGGENVIYLGDGKYYAHGCVGDEGTYIIDEKDLMRTLSALRRPGATAMPFRIDMEMHMDGLAVSTLAVPGGVSRGQG